MMTQQEAIPSNRPKRSHRALTFRYHGIVTGSSDDQHMAVDPVCKMAVVESQAKYTSVRDGTKYYFCSAACKQEFEKYPAKYR